MTVEEQKFTACFKSCRRRRRRRQRRCNSILGRCVVSKLSYPFISSQKLQKSFDKKKKRNKDVFRKKTLLVKKISRSFSKNL